MLNSSVWRGRGARYFFCTGLVLGALTTALGLLLAGSLLRLAAPETVWRYVLAAAIGALALREFGVLRFWLPQNKRLVPEHVNRHGRVFGPLQFGFEMGTSMRTYTPSALPHAAALSVALLAGPLGAVAAGIGFGLGRSAMTIGNLRYSDDNRWDLAWIAHERLIRVMLVAGFLVSAGLLLAG
ncbi:hypothetical protein ABNF97_13880 [Plantactinospora sp. B6F1]|uniref:hypothetical protein n=1 Tax=Plantactinospora sp. B6F1 TaxID=3158971 RepID=UPI0032D8EECA